MDIRTFIGSAERGKSAAIARAVGVHPVMISQWSNGLKPVPVDRCAMLERATDGAVTRRDLRPTDWWVHWPELVDDEHPAALPITTEIAHG